MNRSIDDVERRLREMSANYFQTRITPQAFREFEAIFLPWLDRNQDELDQGGTGNLKELAGLVVAWAATNQGTRLLDQGRDEEPLRNSEASAGSP